MPCRCHRPVRADPWADPSAEPRAEPRGEPRAESRGESRGEPDRSAEGRSLCHAT